MLGSPTARWLSSLPVGASESWEGATPKRNGGGHREGRGGRVLETTNAVRRKTEPIQGGRRVCGGRGGHSSWGVILRLARPVRCLPQETEWQAFNKNAMTRYLQVVPMRRFSFNFALSGEFGVQR